MSLDAEIGILKNLIIKDDYVLAITKAKEIEEKIFDGDLESNLKKKDQSDYDYFMTSKEAKIIFYDEKLYERCLDNIKRTLKHFCNFKSEEIESWFFTEDDSSMITPIHRYVIDFPFKRILLTLLEHEVINEKCSEDLGFVTIDKLLTDLRSICSLNFRFPFPYKDRCCHNYGNTIFNPQLNHFLLITKSLNSDEDYQNLGVEPLKIMDGFERIDIKFTFIMLRKLDDGKFEMVCGLNADAKLSGLPDVICNSILKEVSAKGPLRIIELMKDKSLDEKYESLYLRKKDHYDRMLAHFQN